MSSPDFLVGALLPIVLGAVIGWVTNAIAIKMLFRPLRELRLLGLRLPFTPGVIPRQRRQLAESIARMVSRELLTPELLVRQTRDESFQTGLRRGVAALTGRLLSPRSCGGQAGEADPLQSLLVDALQKLLPRLLVSDQVAGLIGLLVRELAGRSGRGQLGPLLLEEGRLKQGPRRFLETILDGLAGPGLRTAALAWLGRLRADGLPLGSLLGAEERRALLELADRLQPFLADRILAWLGDPKTRALLVERGRSFAREAAGELSGLQRLVLSAGGYDRTLEERMPALVDRLVRIVGESLRDEATRRDLLESLGRELEAIAGRSLADLEQRHRFDALRLCESSLLGLSGWLRRPLIRAKAAGALEDLVIERAELSLQSALEGLSGRTGLELEDSLVEGLVGLLRQAAPALSDALAEGLRAWLAGQRDGGLGEALGLDAQGKADLDDFLTGQAAGLIVAGMPELVRHFDVEGLVIRRIDSLEVEDVERLLLDVIARHLTWINLFGAILGGLIGGLQTLIAVVK